MKMPDSGSSCYSWRANAVHASPLTWHWSRPRKMPITSPTMAAMPRPGLCRIEQNEVREDPQDSRLAARRPFNMRHSPEAFGSELFKESEQLVIRISAISFNLCWRGHV